MSAFVVVKLLATAKASWTDVDAVAVLTRLVCTFDPDGVGEVAFAAVAFDL